MLRQFALNAGFLAQAGICIWVLVWSVRRRAGIDRKLDAEARLIRWVVVYACWLLASIPTSRLGPLRAIPGILGLAFLCWPNLALEARRWLCAGGPEQ
jgi:hypothetical protein